MFRRLLFTTFFLAPLVCAFAAGLVGSPKVSAITGNAALISWTTDVETGTRLSYGTAPDQLTSHAEGGTTAAHELAITGLKPGLKYFFVVGTARKKLATGEFNTSGSPVTVVSPPSTSPASSPVATPKPQSALAKIFAPKSDAPPTRQTWGNPGSLPDHFARHGADFHAKDADDYARMAWEFGQQSKRGGLLVKMDDDGTRRVFDPKTGAFAAYNANGTTKTFFKPGSRDYFTRQPGRPVNN